MNGGNNRGRGNRGGQRDDAQVNGGIHRGGGQHRDHGRGENHGNGQRGRSQGNWRDRAQDDHSNRRHMAAEQPGPRAATLYEENQIEDQDVKNCRGGNHRQPRGRPLTFADLLQLSQETTEPSDIVHRFGNANCGLESLLLGNLSNWDIQELVVAIMGTFCKKQGAAQFQTGFIEIVKILADKNVFKNISTIIMQLAYSRATNLPPKTERLKKLIDSIYHLTCDIVTLIPRFGCNFLGEHFLRDIIGLKNIPAIIDLRIPEPIFDQLDEAVPILKVAII